MNFQVSIKSTQNWGGAGNGELTIKNNGDTITDWKFEITTTVKIIDAWSLKVTPNGYKTTVQPAYWRTTIKAGETFKSGFSYNGDANIIIQSASQGITYPGQIIEPEPTPEDPVIEDPVVEEPIVKKNKLVFAYFTEWSIYDREYSVDMIPADKITHIVYAFMLPNPSQADYDLLKQNYPFPPSPYTAPPTVPEGTLVAHDAYEHNINMQKLKALKISKPHLKVLISVGGWTLSWTLSKVAANATLRSRFVKSAVDFVVQQGFDGIDIDWEYPGKQGAGYNYVDATNDPINYIQLLKDFRRQFDSVSPGKYLITAAVGADPIVIDKMKGSQPYLDYALLMTYDYAGSWGSGGHLSGLYNNPKGDMDPTFNCDSTFKRYVQNGFKPSQLCLGCPIYARGWANVTPTDATQPIFGKSVGGAGTSYSGSAGEPGLTSWRHLRDKIGLDGLNRYYDNVAHAVYVHNSQTGETWSYDDPETAAEKAQYVIDNGMVGMLFWELSDDTRDGKDNIIDAVTNVFSTFPEEPIPEPIPQTFVTLQNKSTNPITINNNTKLVSGNIVFNCLTSEDIILDSELQLEVKTI